MQPEQLVPFVLTLICASISCVFCVMSYIFSRKTASAELQSNVDELFSVVEKMLKEQRKVKMSNVRSGSKDNSDTLSTTGGAIGSVPSFGQQMSKAELRVLARSKNL